MFTSVQKHLTNISRALKPLIVVFKDVSVGQEVKILPAQTNKIPFYWFGAFLVVNLPKNHMMTPDGTDGLEGEPTDDVPL